MVEDVGRVGLALGGGSARGWAHIGVIRALAEAGIKPDVIAGTSIGALVGATYATGQFDALEDWARSVTWRDVVGFIDPTFTGGLVKTRRLFAFFRKYFSDLPIESMDMPFAAVATDLATGQEVWLRSGSLADAVQASMAIPGLVTPVWDGHRWLCDGVLVNPVPVSACRALGAEFIVAVDLNTNVLGRWISRAPEVDEDATEPEITSEHPTDASITKFWETAFPKKEKAKRPRKTPSIQEVIASSLTIMQVHITHSRLSGDPPDLLIVPQTGKVGMMEWHRAADTIEEGRIAAERVLATLPK